MPDATTPEKFDSIFQQNVVIVGGHAVNLWASFYEPRGDQELAKFSPFTSKDGDIYLRDKELAQAVAAAAGWRFRDNPEIRSPVIGHIYLERGDGEEVTVDVLRSVTGLTDKDLSVTEVIELVNGRTYRLPTPDVMLKAKLANLASYEQTDRQDARHARMLVICCRHYLVDAYQAAIDGLLPERDVVDRFMAASRVIRSSQARQLDTPHVLRLDQAIPTSERLRELGRLLHFSAFYAHQVRPQGS
jgi:hypothetical protein